MLKARELTYILLPGKLPPDPEPPPRVTPLYVEAFRLWKEVWAETFLELDGDDLVFSDDYCRQDLVGALFRGERCVALGFFHSVDFRLPTARQDSYFKVWTDEAVRKLLRDGPRILVGSNITVDACFRGKLEDGTRLKNLLVGLMARTFIESGHDAMAGTMRCDRGMQRAAHEFGAEPLQSGVLHHGVEVELISFYRKRLLGDGTLRTDLNVESIWSRRRDLAATSDATYAEAEARTRPARAAGAKRMTGKEETG